MFIYYIMIYWTTYNFIGYSLMKLKLIPINAPLKTSLIVTSLIGGYMTYIYPRKVILKFGDKKYKPPYHIVILGDLLFHQLPLIDILRSPNEISMCGAYIFLPMYFWKKMNETYLSNTTKIYGINYQKLFYTTLGLGAVIGLFQHNYFLNNTVSKIVPNLFSTIKN